MATTTITQTQDVSLTLTLPANIIPTHGKLRYIKRGIIPTASPHLYHLPPLAEFGDVRHVPITNIKSSMDLGDENPYAIDTHGFTARRSPSALHSAPYSRASWNDEELLKSVYLPEVEAMLKHITGSKTVIIESALIRSCVHTEVDGLASSEDKTKEIESEDPWPKMIGIGANAGASPAPKVHLDFSPSGARIHLRQYHSKLAEAGADVIAAENKLIAQGVSEQELKDKYAGPRWAMFSIWRPLKRVTRDPLAFADRRSFPMADYVPVKVVEPTGKGLSSTSSETDAKNKVAQNLSAENVHETETYLAYGSDEHEWCWIWDMTPEEVILIQLFDSEADKRGECGVMHSSVDVPGTEDHEARESIEVRCTAFW